MSMLAEPRQRKRYNLVPRGKALYEDSNRFGTKMLEKMGWSKGKGLGAQENGKQDFVRLRYKNDAEGFGYEDRDDQWTEHEKRFNGLLNSLNNSAVNSDVEETDTLPTIGFGFKDDTKNTNESKNKISGQSLEEKSKNSRARIHYKKFTKGKDLSQYSEKDLANIFGRKANAENVKNTKCVIPEKLKEDTKNLEECQNNFGITTINTGTSLNDYFKQKMKEKNMKRKEVIDNEHQEDEEHISSSDKVENNSKKKKKKLKINETELENKKIEVEEESILQNNELVCDTYKKKNKKNKEKESVIENNEELVEPIIKKKKNKKRKLEELIMGSDNVDHITDTDKKKNKKRKLEEFVNESNNIENVVTDSIKKKKKSKKNSDEYINLLEDAEEVTKTKKKKKERTDNAYESKNSNQSINDDTNESTAIKNFNQECGTNSKKQKRKNTENENLQQLETDPTVCIKTKSKKKKHNLSEESDVNNTNSVSDNENLLTVYTITGFCAEKFRNLDLNTFPGSNMVDVIGYGLNKNHTLEIKTRISDEENIQKLWENVIDFDESNKYTFSNNYIKDYKKKVEEATKENKKKPKFNIKHLKKKPMFSTI